jgi:YD repeat-containing protein
LTIASTDHTGKTTSYAYDGAGRLTSETSPGTAITYQYDRSGNRTSMSLTGEVSHSVAYAYDANNRLLTETKTQGDIQTLSTYRDDPNGNTISKLSETLLPGDGSALEYTLIPAATGGDLYSYDARNRLISAHLNGENITYAYRPDGMRASKTTADATVEHIWDGADIIADVADGAATRYVRGANLILSSAGGATAYYSYNYFQCQQDKEPRLEYRNQRPVGANCVRPRLSEN